MSYLPSSLRTIVGIMHDEHLAMYDAEQKAIGLAHPSFGAWVMERWGLPAAMVEAVEYHHHPTRSRFGFDLAGIVGLARHRHAHRWQHRQRRRHPHA